MQEDLSPAVREFDGLDLVVDDRAMPVQPGHSQNGPNPFQREDQIGEVSLVLTIDLRGDGLGPVGDGDGVAIREPDSGGAVDWEELELKSSSGVGGEEDPVSPIVTEAVDRSSPPQRTCKLQLPSDWAEVRWRLKDGTIQWATVVQMGHVGRKGVGVDEGASGDQPEVQE